MKVTLIIPALDEETAIGPMLRAIDRSVVQQIVVGDNGSRDATAEVARAEGAEVVLVPERGYGAACLGAMELIAPDAGIILFMDADGSDDPAEIPLLLGPIERGDADLVIGARTTIESGALTPQQRIGNWIATHLIAILYRHHYSDLGPFRAVRRTTLERIGMQDRRFGWTVEMQVRALQIRARVLEVPVRYRKRVGRSKISGTVLGVIRAAWGILSTIARLRLR